MEAPATNNARAPRAQLACHSRLSRGSDHAYASVARSPEHALPRTVYPARPNFFCVPITRNMQKAVASTLDEEMRDMTEGSLVEGYDWGMMVERAKRLPSSPSESIEPAMMHVRRMRLTVVVVVG